MESSARVIQHPSAAVPVSLDVLEMPEVVQMAVMAVKDHDIYEELPNGKRGQYLGTSEVWLAPNVPEEHLPVIRRQLQALEEVYPPAPRGQLLTRVYALLEHYRTAAEQNGPHNQDLEQMLAEDWADDLEEFPMAVVNEAVKRWRRDNKWKPRISEIRDLCQTIMHDEFKVLTRLRKIVEKAEKGERRIRLAGLAAKAVKRMPGIG